MTSWEPTEALTEQCRNCSNWTIPGDKFCRRCGTRRETGATESMCETTALRADERVSGSLSSRSISRFQHRVVQTTGSLHFNRAGGFAVAVLISIPMWLLIVLLSPIEAYSCARAASSR
jgi:hypothetical protein